MPTRCTEAGNALDTDTEDDVLFFLRFTPWALNPMANPPRNTGLVGKHRVAIVQDFLGTVSQESDEDTGFGEPCDLNGDGEFDLDILGWFDPAVSNGWTFDNGTQGSESTAAATWIGEIPGRQRVGVAFSELYESLELDDAILFFLADHGEEFYEHGELTHGQNLHTETVRVPLFLRMPGADAPRGRVQANVTTLDVLPTPRALLGLSAGAQDQGRDLLAAGVERPILGSLAAKSGENGLDGDLRSLVRGDYRLITEQGGPAKLYDLAADRQEQNDLAAARPALVAELLDEFERAESAAPPYPPTTRVPETPSDAMLEHLRGIGYAGEDE